MNEEEDEGAEENALVESAVAAKTKVAKAAAKQQMVIWVGKGEAGTDGSTMYRYL